MLLVGHGGPGRTGPRHGRDRAPHRHRRGCCWPCRRARWLLLAGAVLGTLSPNGQEAGPFTAMEQALLPGTVRSGSAVRLFGWYNVFGFLPAAAGARRVRGSPWGGRCDGASTSSPA